MLLLSGCFGGKPDAANIELRKQVQALESANRELRSKQAGDRATIDALQSGRMVSTLPVERLDRLFTVASLRMAKLTVGDDLNPASPGDEGFKVSFCPVDQFGDDIKAAGSFTVELFDLKQPDTRLGSWTVPTADAQRMWVSSPVMDAYVFAARWQKTPAQSDLTAKVTFIDELTGGQFEATGPLRIAPPR
jgi:hypothetical protein